MRPAQVPHDIPEMDSLIGVEVAMRDY